MEQFKKGDKVLVRDHDIDPWKGAEYFGYNEKHHSYRHVCITSIGTVVAYRHCRSATNQSELLRLLTEAEEKIKQAKELIGC